MADDPNSEVSNKRFKRTKARKYVSQADIPRHSLEEALKIPRAIHDNYALEPTRPLSVAQALDMVPTSSYFRTLTGAATAYGLTEGAYNAREIIVTPLGRRIVSPTEEGDDLIAKREAILKPRVASEFLQKYDSKPLPRDDIAKNVLFEMGVPKDKTYRCLELIVDNAKDVGALKQIKGQTYIDLESSPIREPSRIVPDSTISPANEPFLSPREPIQVPVPATVTQVLPGMDDSPLRRGLQVDAYVLEERLGAGFSAEVWSASVVHPPLGVDVQEGAKVAIKFYHSHAMALPDQVIRIEREYRIAQRIRHPNLIRIYEFVMASSRPHHNFLVMDVAKGQPLKNIIPPLGLSVQKTLQIIQQILMALDELHSAGALHRDIKPGNISVQDDPTGLHATLLDLGIVSILHERGMTVGSRFVGSKHWAPLEQLMGDPIDQRSDIYSVGAVAYHMLTGDLPYSGKGTEAAIAVEMSKKPLRLQSIELMRI